jgi:NTP pyrophosphatase (non-canonical NTP hydrolase)
MKHLEEAIRFRKAMGQPIATADELVHELQMTLITEEYQELLEAFDEELDRENGQYELLKELSDLVFVCYQFAAARGLDLDTALTRVFESNMSKLVDGKPLRREDGKVLKGPNYQPPIFDDLL